MHREFIEAQVASAIREGGPFVIEAAGSPEIYVQGGLTGPNALYLEAADRELQGRGCLSDEQAAALQGLGFARAEQNFTQTVTLPDSDAVPALAAEVLTKVFEVFGVPQHHPIRSGSDYSCNWLDVRDVRGTPYPPYVQTERQRRRWNWANLIAAGLSMQGSGGLDNAFVWQTARSIYQDETFADDGTESDFEDAVLQARAAGLVPGEDSFY